MGSSSPGPPRCSCRMDSKRPLTHSASSSSSSSSAPATPNTNGPKFGHGEIHFGDVGPGLRANPGGSISSGTPPKKARAADGGGAQQPPRCQVEGCNVDLSEAKTYYSRHKVCGTHSKSATVVVRGLEQRFCQQCSRFHQLHEFDQGKRSCRRRLAGHNERRRKPPPGSLLSSRHNRFSSCIYDNSTGGAGYVIDYCAYPRPPPREAWIAAQASNQGPGNQTNPGRENLQLHPLWQSSPENHQYDPFLQGPSPSVGGTSSSGPGFSPGDSFNPSCALSLLSNQQSDSASQASGPALNSDVPSPEASVGAQVISPLDAVCNFSSASWTLKVNEAPGIAPDIAPDLGLVHVSQPLDGPFSNGLEFSLQSRRQNTDQDHSQDYNSTQQMHWSL
ncbi:squamosa promoter-binding-like protein 9 [Rhodamnia argentea]|uniref:Squamosa promoter-binding-like protein 9 n=1 Tax=Rhodamnia argentea TaxID=178133 RepID=A0ABM3HPZ2_9MYRT|nr:squamosa promoter-binding-like protein 9 [Rhodamnia argentea]